MEKCSGIVVIRVLRTLNKNVTTYDATIKHSGNYSAKLQSQYVALFGIGAFAAGNVFVGKFLKIDGTDGILRFGRPFTSRPSNWCFIIDM